MFFRVWVCWHLKSRCIVSSTTKTNQIFVRDSSEHKVEWKNGGRFYLKYKNVKLIEASCTFAEESTCNTHYVVLHIDWLHSNQFVFVFCSIPDCIQTNVHFTHVLLVLFSYTKLTIFGKIGFFSKIKLLIFRLRHSESFDGSFWATC